MILLDEIDVETKQAEAKSKLHRRETLLPPYSSRWSFRLPLVASNDSLGRGQSTYPTSVTSTSPDPSLLHSGAGSFTPHSPNTRLAPNSPSPSLSAFDSYGDSSQTLLVPGPSHSRARTGLPTPPSSTFSSSSTTLSKPPSYNQSNSHHASGASSSSTSRLSLPPFRLRPPAHLKAANNVHIQRGAGSITGSFLIDPAHTVPPFLLSCDESDDGMQDIHEDDPRARRQDSGSSGISRSRRRMKKRARTPSILLETNSSDICVDLWIRDECVESQNRRAKARSRRNNRAWDSSGCDEAEDEYWPSDWTMTQPWPHKTREVIIEAFSRKGNISLRIHAQSHHRLRIRVTSCHGSVYVGIPRYFIGHICMSSSLSNAPIGCDSLSSLDNESSTELPSYLHNSPSIPVYGKGLAPSITSSALRRFPSSPSVANFKTSPRQTLRRGPHRHALSRGGSTESYDADDNSSEGAKSNMMSLAMGVSEVTKAMLPRIPPFSGVHFGSSIQLHPVSNIVSDGEAIARYIVGAMPAQVISTSLSDELQISFGSRGRSISVCYNDEVPLFREDGLLTKIGRKLDDLI